MASSSSEFQFGSYESSLTTAQDLLDLQKTLAVRSTIVFRLPTGQDSPKSVEEDWCCAYLSYFQTCGLTFPIPLFLLNILKFLGLAFPQMVPSFVRHVIGTYVCSYEDDMDLSPSQFFDFYVARTNSSVKGSFYLTPRERRGVVVVPSKYSHRDANWQKKFFFFRVSPETISSLNAFRRVPNRFSSYIKNTSSTSLTAATSSRLTLLRRGDTDWDSFTPLPVKMAYSQHARQWTALAEPASVLVAVAPIKAADLPGIYIGPPAPPPSISQRTCSRSAYMGPSSSAQPSRLAAKRPAPVAIPPATDDTGSSSTTPSGERLKRMRVPVGDRVAPPMPSGGDDSATSSRRSRTILVDPTTSSFEETSSSTNGGGASPGGLGSSGSVREVPPPILLVAAPPAPAKPVAPLLLLTYEEPAPSARSPSFESPRPERSYHPPGLTRRGMLGEGGLQRGLSSLHLFLLLRKSPVSSFTRDGLG